MARKTKSTEQLRDEIAAQKAAAAARAEADRALADRMLAKLRSELADADDDELQLVFERMLAARMHDQPVAPFLLAQVRAERSGVGA